MKTSFAVLGCLALSAFSAVAQDVPETEAFVGYTFMRVNSASNIPAYSANGGGGQFAYNFNKWFAVVADAGAVHNGDIGGFQLDNTWTNFVVGPRFSFRYTRLRPYLQTLFGMAHVSASTQLTGENLVVIAQRPVVTPLPVDPNLPVVTPLSVEIPFNEYRSTIFPGRPVTARAVTSQDAFAMAIGGGLDVKINKHVSIRPIGLDWFQTRLQNLRTLDNNNQQNLRYTAGVNFTFGAQ